MEADHVTIEDSDSGRHSPLPQTEAKPLARSVGQVTGGAVETDSVPRQQIDEAISLVAELEQGYDEDELQQAVLRLFELAQAGSDELKTHLEHINVQQAVFSLMKHLPGCANVQQTGCRFLFLLVEQSDVLRKAIAIGDFHSFLIPMMYANITNPVIQEAGLKIFSKLLEYERLRDQLILDGQQEDLVQLCGAALTTFRDVRQIQAAASIVLSHLLADDDEIQDVFMDNALAVVLNVLRTAPDIETQIHLLRALKTTANNPKHATTLIVQDVHVYAMETCTQLPTNARLMKEATELIDIFSQRGDVQQVLLSCGFIENSLCVVMYGLRSEAAIQKAGLGIISSLVGGDDKTGDTTETIVNIVYNAMFTHMDREAIQVSACTTLSVVLEKRPAAHTWIGDSNSEKQKPLHNLCLGAILVYKRSTDVFVAACDAIYWMAADNERLCKAVMDKNVHVAIIDGLRRHRNCGAAAEAGCRAIRGICIFHDDHKNSAVMYGALDDLVSTLDRHADNAAVLVECISAVTCLADIEMVSYQCFVQTVPGNVVRAMREHGENGLLQEAGLEAIAVFAGTECGPAILIGEGALDVSLVAMHTFPDNAYIIQKGMKVLQLFAGSQTVHTKHIRYQIASIMSNSLHIFHDVNGLVSEVCVTIQLLAESGWDLSREFVNQDCHEHLFSILENKDEDQALLQLVSECLYVLSQEQNMKSTMLLSACKSGNVPATECLIELGADVNIEDGLTTPLFIAVVHGHEHIVRLLLKQEVRDISMALKQSLTLEFHTITGLLLQQLGYDMDGGGITWSGLDLTTLELEWIIVALTSQAQDRWDTDIGRRFVSKIKTGEKQRRERILRHSNSDTILLYKRRRENRTRKSMTCGREIDLMKPPLAEKDAPVFELSESEEQYTPVFELSESEEQYWKQTTITGANVPFNENDPRQTLGNSIERGHNVKYPWKRKGSRSPLGSFESSRTLSYDFTNSKDLFPRKNSAPVVTSLLPATTIARRRKYSVDSCCSESDAKSTESSNCTLISIDVSDNKIPSILSLADPELRQHFQHLQRLDLSGNAIVELPDAMFENMPVLHALDVRLNRLATFPASALKCESLKELLLSRNKIKEMKISHFNQSLKKLDISHNELKCLPARLGIFCGSLTDLNLSHNDLISLPESPLGLHHLKKLDLAHNSVDYIPESFLHTCTKLEVIDLSYNNLSKLPSDAVAAQLFKLNKIILTRNQLAGKFPTYIPPFVLALPSLRTIYVGENQLTGLPDLSLWKSNTIKDFIANRNKISALNFDNAKVWNKLEKLHLSHNSLTEIPRSIGQMSSLTSLDISYNKNITSLPDELGKCQKIWEMPTEGLDLDINSGLVKWGVRDTIRYLHNRLKKAQSYYRMKLMVVGYGGKGKTTLLNTLMRSSNTNNYNLPTIGVVVRDWKYMWFERKANSCESLPWVFRSGRKVEYTLNTWDFAGQEDFHSTHHCYLSNRAVYLVVFDLMQGVADVDRLKSWLCSIHSRAPGCPVVVVGTHLDKLQQDKSRFREVTDSVSEKLREFIIKPGFPTVSAVVMVDGTCENDYIEQLRGEIKKIVDEFRIRGKRVMGEKVPASYVKLTDLLCEEARALPPSYPVIQYARLKHIVQSADLDLDENELQQAVVFLHESGVLLHYEDSTLQLNDFYFIDPGWLCRMMAQVVTFREMNPYIKDGIMRLQDFDIVFKGNAICPQAFIPQYLKLLQKFQIALPQSELELLIPCRLPLDRPHITLPAHKTIERIYRMPHVPIGLWSRLISRTIVLASNLQFRTLMKLCHYPRKVCWRRGLYIYWSEDEYFLMDSHVDDDTESIVITVPESNQGIRMLGQIADYVDNLIDEWYPGLTIIDPMMGQEILERLAPCRQCSDAGEYTVFSLKTLQRAADTTDVIHCPVHHGDVLLSELAPDLVLADLESELWFDTNAFQVYNRTDDESALEELFTGKYKGTDSHLADGGFGEVYRGIYKDKNVAIKLFREIADIHPLNMLRQEVSIMRCLSHPSVVALRAVGIRPCVIVLELALYGTLGDLINRGRPMHRHLQLKIALQVADGLTYLHNMMIIYRDMKPDNVLIFNTSLSVPINAKISDYGIARFSTLEGLKAQEGTLAYRAPEVIRKENYSCKADVFSYGLTMYVMLTGRHPFDNLETKGDMDRATAEGMAIPPLQAKGAAVWPDMHSLIMRCLQHESDKRPEAISVFRQLQRPELLCLRNIVSVSVSITVECFAVEVQDGRDLVLWTASGDSEIFQLSRIVLYNDFHKTKGALFRHGRILCMQTIEPHYLALGTQMGKVWILDTQTNTLDQCSAQLSDSVLCMSFVKRERDGGMLLAGLANGQVAIFLLAELLQKGGPPPDPICMRPGAPGEPVLCMVRHGRHRVYLSCGCQVLVFNTAMGIGIERIIEVDKHRSVISAPIYTLAVMKSAIIFSRKGSPMLEIWSTSNDRIERTFCVAENFGIPKPGARITAMTLVNHVVWVGTHGGHIGLIDINTMAPLCVTHRYARAVRSLVFLRESGVTKYRVVLSGGKGFKDQTDQDKDKVPGVMCGSVIFWDAELAQCAKAMVEYEKKRRELYNRPRSYTDKVTYQRL